MPALFEHILNPLLGMSMTAAFVAVVVVLLRLILKKRAPRQVVCLLWLVVFARLLIPVMVESPISLVPPALEDIVQTEQTEEPAQTAEPLNPGVVDDTPVNTPAVPESPTPGNVGTTPADPVVSQPVTDSTQSPVVTPPVAENPPVLEAPSEPEAPTEAPVVEEPAAPLWMYIVPAVWLAGVAVMLAVGVGSYIKLRRRVYDAIRTGDGVWEHPSLTSPFILGLIRPKIYLPMGIEGQPRQFILHHERAHLRRLDHVVKPICWLALAIHWFNPLAWAAFLLMSRDIETACDESVIRKLGSGVKADYSATLLALATDKRFPAPSPLSFGEGDAKVRIKNVLSFKKPALWVTIAAVVVAVIAAVCLLTDPVTPDTPDLSGYTTKEEYPGLYFLEEPSSTVGTKITAYKLMDGELVLVGGYDEHMANNFSGLIGPDGEEEFLFLSPDEVYAMFEELLAEACREMDPDWTPPDGSGEDDGPTDPVELGDLVYEDDLIALYVKDKGKYTFLKYGEYTQLLNNFHYNSHRPYCTTWEADADGDGVKELYIIHQTGSGTGAAVDELLVCEPNGEALDVWAHGSTEIQTEFNENRTAVYHSESKSVEITYGGATYMIVVDDDWYNTYMPQVTELAYINGYQVSYAPSGDDSILLSFALSISVEGVPMLFYLPDEASVSCLLRFTGDGFEVVDGLRFRRERPDDGPEVPPASGELFLSALNDGTTIFLPETGSHTLTLSGLLAELSPDMGVTEMAVIDLDLDGVKELLLRLETPSIGYGTLILHYDSSDGQIYGYVLWVRAFNQVKTDGTFVYSGSASVSGVARIFFTSGGYKVEKITYSEEDYPDRNIYYYVNKQPATEAAFYAAFAAQQEKPGVVWAEYTAENAEALIRAHFADSNDGPPAGLAFLASLPFEIVTSDTLPTDPEEYYLVAKLPESHVYLYARNHGQDSMLLWDGNFWLPLEGRVAHTGHMNLPEMYLLEETSSTTTVAVVSEVNTGTGVGVKELAVYVTGETMVEASAYTGMRDYVYDWHAITEEFNENNTLIYDKETNSLTLLWNGTAYCPGTLTENLGQFLALEDGYTGTLLANGDIINFTHNGGNSFTVTVETAIAGRPLSIGAVGFELTWNVEFTGSGFETTDPAITVTGKDRTVLKAAFPEENIYLFALGNGGEYYYLVEGMQLYKVPGSGILTDLDANCQLVDLDGDGQMELAIVGNHYSGSSSASILSVFDKGVDGWKYYRLPSYYSSNTTDYVPPFGGPDLMNDAATFTIGSDPTQVTMHLSGFDFLFTVSGEVAARDKDYHVREYSRFITWENGSYYLRIPGEVCRRYTGMVGEYSDSCGVSFEFVCRLEYNADGTFEQVPVGVIPQYPNFTQLDTVTGRNAALYFDTEHRPFLVEGSRSGRLPYDEDRILARCEQGTLMETQLSDGTPAYLVELRDGSGEVQAALYVVWSEAENAWVYPAESRPYLSVNSSSQWQWLSAGSGDFYAIRSSDLTAVMWGSPDYGYYYNIPMEAPVEFISGAVALSSGFTGTTMAIDVAGTLWGLGTAVDPVTHEPRQLLDSVAMVSCGQYDSYAVRCDGSLWSYDHNNTGLPTLKIVEVNGVTWYKLMDGVISVEAGGFGSGHAILSDHTLWAWDGTQNKFQKVADNVAAYSDGRIIDLDGNLLDNDGSVLLTGVKYATLHYALKTDGTLWALTTPDPDTLWGVGTPLEEPVLITDSVSEIACGEFESILLKTDGSLWKLAIDGTLTDISFVLH